MFLSYCISLTAIGIKRGKYQKLIKMRKLFSSSMAVVMLSLFLFSCSKESLQVAPEQLANEQKAVEGKAAASPAPHMALERQVGAGHVVYKFVSLGGIVKYAPIGMLMNAGSPILNVTGLASIPSSGIGLAISRTSPTVWSIWKFPLSSPASAGVTGTVTTTDNLSDIEYDAVSGKLIALDVTAQKVVTFPISVGATMTSSYSYSTVPNVNGLCILGSSHFVLGFTAAGVGYLMKCAPGFGPGWTLPGATFTPPLIPSSALNGGGCWFDTGTNSFIVGGAQAGLQPHWALTIPTNGPGAALPPTWLQSDNGSGSRVYFLDFAPL
jgi:hypothetical protein